MPRQIGIIKLKGTLNGICYYKLNNVHIQRKAVGPSKERINNDPAFAAVKANNIEFGGASKLATAICTGLQPHAATFKDSYMTGRLSGRCRAIIQKGSGMPGQREANLSNAPSVLIGFQLHNEQPFNQIYNAKSSVSIDNSRTNIQIHIANSAACHLNHKPKSATHFRLTAAISVVSNYQWSHEANTYVPVNPYENALGASMQSIPLLCKIKHQNIQFNLQNPIASNIPENVAITVWLGIQYGNSSTNEFISLKTAQAMECIGVI